MKAQQIVLISIVGFALLCLLGLWWLKAESPAPQPPQPAPSAPLPKPEAPPAPAPKRAPSRAAPAPAPVQQPQPFSPPALPTMNEKPAPPKMTPLRPDWQVKRLHFAHDAPTALEAIRPLVGECFRDNAGQLRPGDQVILSFGTGQDGHFEKGQVESSTVQDPYLQACLQDALHDATTSDSAQGQMEYYFKYQADGGTEAGPAPF